MSALSYETFKQKALAVGAKSRRCSATHWQVENKFIVNYYPTTGTIYVNGTTGKPKRTGNIDQAIRAARVPPALVAQALREPRKNSEYYKGIKDQLLRAGAVCYWCRSPFTDCVATIEHIIPLARGGSNGRDNLTLACEACNASHGSGQFLYDDCMAWRAEQENLKEMNRSAKLPKELDRQIIRDSMGVPFGKKHEVDYGDPF